MLPLSLASLPHPFPAAKPLCGRFFQKCYDPDFYCCKTDSSQVKWNGSAIYHIKTTTSCANSPRLIVDSSAKLWLLSELMDADRFLNWSEKKETFGRVDAGPAMAAARSGCCPGGARNTSKTNISSSPASRGGATAGPTGRRGAVTRSDMVRRDDSDRRGYIADR